MSNEKATAIKLITAAPDLAKESTNLAKAIQRNDTRVQKYLLSEISHIEEHRNPTRLNTFLTSIKGKGVRTVAMHSFIQTFANLKWDDEKSLYVMKPKRSAEKVKASFAKACETKWTDHKPEQEIKDWDFEDKLKALFAQAHKRLKQVSDTTDPVKKEQLAKHTNVDLVKLAEAEQWFEKNLETVEAEEQAATSQAVKDAEVAKGEKVSAGA